MWLVSRFSIINHALRDTFTSGGTVLIEGKKFPKIFQYLTENLESIYHSILEIDEDDLSHYWQVDIPIDNPIEIWKSQCLKYSKQNLDKTQFDIIKRTIE